jgi:general secretion pathway protein N
MRKSGLSVLAGTLLSGLFTSAGAQVPARVSVFPPAEPTLSKNSLGREPTIPPGSVATAKSEPLAGNPLSAVALSELSETRARPIFSPSRRPPVSVVHAALPAQPVEPASPVKPEPDHPLLTVLGMIVGESVEIGVFFDEASHDAIRIKAGDSHDGWTLSTISGRVAIFQKQGYRAATLALPVPSVEATAPTGSPPPGTLVPPNIPATTKEGAKRPPREG